MKTKIFLYSITSILIIVSTAIIYRYVNLENLKTSIYKTETIKVSTEANKIASSGVLASQYKKEYFPSNGKIISLNYTVGDTIFEGEILASIKKENSSQTENIIASKNGTITSIPYSIGEYYDSTEPIVTTEDLSYMKVLVNLEGDDYEYVRLNQKAKINTPLLEYDGIVSYISPSGVADPSDPSKSYLPIEITLDGKVENLKSGVQVTVNIIVEEKENIIVINPKLIKRDMNGSYVYILQDDVAHKKYIKTSTEFSNKIEVIYGLKENDVVVLDPYDNLLEGKKVIPEESIPANSPLNSR